MRERALLALRISLATKKETMMKLEELVRLAQERVLASPQLKAYAEVILADWPEAHWQWVLTANEDAIVAWAQEADVRDEQEDGRDRP